MEVAQLLALNQMGSSLAALTPDAIAFVQVQKAWSSPIKELGAYSGDNNGFRLRILTRAWLVGGGGDLVKLWFYMPSLNEASLWLERLQQYSCWTVDGRIVDVGHPSYQTIAVSDMQPMSAAMMRVFLPLIAQFSAER